MRTMTRSDIVKNSSIGGRTFCIRTEAGQGTAFTMDVNGKRYQMGIVCLRTTVRQRQTEVV